MQIYEIGYLILPSIAEEDIAGVAHRIKTLVESAGGAEIDSETPFKHELAYTMSKTVGASHYVVSDAFLGWIKFDLPAEASAQAGLEHPIDKIKAGLEKMDELLRFLLIKTPRETAFTFAKARVAMEEKAKSERENKEEALPVLE